MIDDLFMNALIDTVLDVADRNGDTYLRKGTEIIKKFCALSNDLGNKLSAAPHENYPEILRHLEDIEALLKSEEDK